MPGLTTGMGAKPTTNRSPAAPPLALPKRRLLGAAERVDDPRASQPRLPTQQAQYHFELVGRYIRGRGGCGRGYLRLRTGGPKRVSKDPRFPKPPVADSAIPLAQSVISK